MIAKLEPYSDYKESGIRWLGQLPDEWDVAPGRSLFEEVVERGYPEEQMLSVTIRSGVVPQENLLEETQAKDSSNLDRKAYKLVQPGDIAYNKMRAWQGAFGRSTYRGIVSPAYIVLRSRGALNPDLAHFLLRIPSFAKEAERWSYGITSDQWSLRPKDFKRIYFPIPPPETQGALVWFLDHMESRIDRLLSIKESLRRLLDEEIDGMIYRTVTSGLRPGGERPSGVDWLGDIPEDWEIAPVRARYSVKLGKMLDAKRITGASLVSYLRNTDVQWDQINTDDLPKMDILPAELERYTVKAGDLLVCEGGEVGRAAIWQGPEEVGFQKALHRLRPFRKENDHPRFLYYLLRAVARRGVFQAEGGKSTIAHLTAERLRRFRLPFPPGLEQEAIVKKLDEEVERRENLNAVLDSQVAAIREYRVRLVSDVVTGRLDIGGVAGSETDDSNLDEFLEEVAS